MGIIHILDPHIADLIAAGEVVERPASAVKELIENSIDAGATVITAEIRGGGSAFLRVTDNGCGMAYEDVPLCVRRHATSKLETEEDLHRLLSYGFRGEALAALASISAMRIMTRPAAEETGTLFSCDCGSVTEYCRIACPAGTTIIAERLYENVPVRRGFLKKDVTETANVVTVAEHMALSHPEISVRMIVDGELRFSTPGDGKLLSVIHALYGTAYAKKLIGVDDLTDGITVTGYVGRPDAAKGNRSHQILFVNGRNVRSPLIVTALEQAFTSYCPAEKFPVCVLFVTVPPGLVDVNVHPAKETVKFAAGARVFEAVYAAVRNALAFKLTRPGAEGVEQLWLTGSDVRRTVAVPEEDGLRAAQSEEEAKRIAEKAEQGKAVYEQIDLPVVPPPVRAPQEASPPAEELPPPPTEEDAPPEYGQWSFSASEFGISAPIEPAPVEPVPEVPAKEERTPPEEEAPPSPSPAGKAPDAEKKAVAEASALAPLPYYRVAGVLFNCYILVELADKMLMIDKHAAHERILFEEKKQEMRSGPIVSQILLVPLAPSLDTRELSAALSYRVELAALGYRFTYDRESRELRLREIPASISSDDALDWFETLVGSLAADTASPDIARSTYCERALFQASCKAAVKAGRDDSPETIDYITRLVLTRPSVRFCPHGRPVAFEMTKAEVERLFSRT